MRSYEFAEDFSKTGASCRIDVGIDPYNAFSELSKILGCYNLRGKESKKTEAVFLVALRDSVGK